MAPDPLPSKTELAPLLARRRRSSTTGTPLFWAHQRTVSNTSYTSVLNFRKPIPISLEDHTELHGDETSPLWAKRVVINDYVVVSGGGAGIGSYIVWNCTVETLDGGPMKVRKRYSEFDELRQNLMKTFPHSEGAMPPLPPKSVISKFRPRFLEKRQAGLAYFLNCILLNPEFSGSPVLKDFLFS